MEYITVKQIAKQWNISERRVINLIKNNRIPGAFKNGMCWNIPTNTRKPTDKRSSLLRTMEDKKTVVIAGINSDIGIELSKVLLASGYKIIGFYQKESKIDDELRKKDIFLKEVDYFNRDNLLKVTSEIKEDIFGFVFMEIYFTLEDTIDFDYDKFEDSYKVNVFAANLLVRELVKKIVVLLVPLHMPQHRQPK